MGNYIWRLTPNENFMVIDPAVLEMIRGESTPPVPNVMKAVKKAAVIEVRKIMSPVKIFDDNMACVAPSLQIF